MRLVISAAAILFMLLPSLASQCPGWPPPPPPYTGPLGGGTPGVKPNPGPYAGPAGGGTPVAVPGFGAPAGGANPGTTPPPSIGAQPARPPEIPLPRERRGATTPSGPVPPGLQRLSDWEAWWALNSDRPEFRNSSRPGQTSPGNPQAEGTSPVREPAPAAEIRAALIPALKDRSAEVRAAAATALGRAAGSQDGSALALLAPLLGDRDDHVRKAACLGIGYLGNADGADILLDVARNSPEGRRLAARGRNEVPSRVRAFAAVGLGLAGAQSGLPRETVAELVQLATALESDELVRTAAASALQMVDDQGVIPALHAIFCSQRQSDFARAQAGVALGKAGARNTIRTLRNFLADPSPLVASSAAIALGLLSDRDDQESIESLAGQTGSAASSELKHFALMALAEIGGPQARRRILEELAGAKSPAARAFAALAAGVAGALHGDETSGIGKSLLDAFHSERAPEARAALAAALGLLRHEPARDALRQSLADASNPSLQGHASRSLALLGDRDAATDIRTLLTGTREPSVHVHAAEALRILDDEEAGELLRQAIGQPAASRPLHRAAIEALGRRSDDASIAVLREVLENRTGAHPESSRAAAAATLGRLGDRDGRQALLRLQASSNYYAFTPELGEVLTLR